MKYIAMALLNFGAVILPSFYFYKSKIDFKTKIFLIISGSILFPLSIFININKIVFPIYILLIALYLFLVNIKHIQFVFYFILFYFIFTFIEAFLAISFINILKEKYQQMLTNIYVQFAINISLFIFNLVVAFIIKKLRDLFKFKFSIVKENKKSFLLMTLNLIIMFFIISIMVVLTNKNTDFNNKYFYFLSWFIIVFFILNLITCYMVINYSNKEAYIKFKIKEFEAVNEYTKTLEEVNTEVRKFRHDYVNMLSTMSEYLNENDINGLKIFFEKNIIPLGESMNKKNLRVGLLGNIKVPELKGILISKIIKAQELGIDVFVEIPEIINKIEIDVIDLARVIGIIMDNAVEAALESKEKIVRLGIFINNQSVNLVFMNSYCNKEIYLSEILKEGFSTKGSGRGLGLNILQEIVNNHSNVTLDTCIEKDVFIQDLSIF